jgi:hypothetical protein
VGPPSRTGALREITRPQTLIARAVFIIEYIDQIIGCIFAGWILGRAALSSENESIKQMNIRSNEKRKISNLRTNEETIQKTPRIKS